jgi:hypothetical protein
MPFSRLASGEVAFQKVNLRGIGWVSASLVRSRFMIPAAYAPNAAFYCFGLIPASKYVQMPIWFKPHIGQRGSTTGSLALIGGSGSVVIWKLAVLSAVPVAMVSAIGYGIEGTFRFWRQ